MRKKKQKNSNSECDQRVRRAIDCTNTRWTIIVVSILNILLISYVLTNCVVGAEKIMDFISYSTAILSITLSIYAIVYTRDSNVSLQRQFEKIEAATEQLDKVSNSISVQYDAIKGKLETSINGNMSFQKIQDEIYKRLNMNQGGDVAENKGNDILV